MKQILTNYTFDKTAKTITFPDYTTIDLARISAITHLPTGTFIYILNGGATNGGSISGNVLTLNYDTTSFSDSDTLRVDFEVDMPFTDGQAIRVGNARTKFRDGFASPDPQPKADVWIEDNTNDDHIITQGGNSSGSAYLRISMSPFVDASGYSLLSRQLFKFPMRVGFGISTSQRIVGQEVFVGMVGDDGTGLAVDTSLTTPYTDKAITGATITVASNVGTVTLANHGLRGGDRISIYGCADSRANVGPVVVSVLDKNLFNVPIVNSAGSYSSTGGMVRVNDPLRYASNGAGYLLENTTVTNASTISRRNGAKFRSTNFGVSSTAGSQTNTNSYTDAWNAASNQELELMLDEVRFRSFTSDAGSALTGLAKYTNTVPDDDVDYHIQIRARNLEGMTIPVAQITAIAKTGTTTATVTTDVPHGLSTTSYVQIYGVRDITNFPALTAATQVASVINSTQFTVVIGSAVTASSAGGAVWLVQGGTLAPGIIPQSIQSISRSNDVLTVVGNTTWATPLPGEYVHVWGMDGSAAAYDGAYKVLRVNAANLELESTGTDFGSINCGGTVIRRTDVRIHFTRVMDYTRHVTEISGGRGGTNDINNSVPVSISGSATIGSSQSTGSNTTIWNAAGWGGFPVNDIASAAITGTQTSAAIAPGSVANVGTYAHQFFVPVTAVSGTNPTMDVIVQESPDTGTTWFDVYHFPRITAVGNYVSPIIPSTFGSRFRYVRTVTGTAPSITNALWRVQHSRSVPFIRQFFDRTIVPTTLNSETPVWNVDGSNTLTIGTKASTVGGTPVVLKVMGRYGNSAADWFDITDSSGTIYTISPTATTQPYLRQITNVSASQVKLVVSTAGVGTVLEYVQLRGAGL